MKMDIAPVIPVAPSDIIQIAIAATELEGNIKPQSLMKSITGHSVSTVMDSTEA